MYVIKKLQGISAVQTLSRLNRICPEYPRKTTFVLDFVNQFDDIMESFAPYCTHTWLKDGIDMADLIDISAKIDGYNILMPLDEYSVANAIATMGKKAQSRIKPYFTKVVGEINKLDDKHKQEFKGLLIEYRRIYERLKLISGDTFSDELKNRYVFIDILLRHMVEVVKNGENIEINISIENVQVLENETYTGVKVISDPVMELSAFGAMKIKTSKLDLLSNIIRKINENLGLSAEENAEIQAIIDITNQLLNSETLQSGAKNNTKSDFTKLYNDEVVDILTSNYENFSSFYGALLDNDIYRNEIFAPLSDDIYNNIQKR